MITVDLKTRRFFFIFVAKIINKKVKVKGKNRKFSS
jgi:hypothetical protein